MAEGFFGRGDKTSWREIVLEHIRKILECSRTEFLGGFWNETGNNPSIKTYVFDTRATYINSINALADVLLPFFDKDMKTAFKDHATKREKDAIRKEITKKYPKEAKTLDPKGWKREIENFRLEHSRTLFQELNKLLRRTDYLKSAIYQEDDDEKSS